jgi:hypothetical protein
VTLHEHRCRCGALLFRTDAEHGQLEIVCRKCKRKQTLYFGGYKQRPALTVVRA